MRSEEEIENQVAENLKWFGYPGAQWIRRARLGREGYGAVDLLVIPRNGPHKIVLIEVKHENSKDTPGRLLGQLLAYYIAVLKMGSQGVECFRQFALKDPQKAHSTPHKSIQQLSGLGPKSKHKDLERLRGGERLKPSEVALVVAIGTDHNKEPESMKEVREWLWAHAGLDVSVVLARSDGAFTSLNSDGERLWRPRE